MNEQMRQRSHELDLSKYDTDKIANGYLPYYDSVIAPWIDERISLLEIGVFKGGSLKLWQDYFPAATIVGIDAHLPPDRIIDERIKVFQGSQTDTDFLTRVASQMAPDGFDIIIDDASHIGAQTGTTFWHLFDNHLKSGGLYVIEDWGTGYWDDWPDGKTVRPPSWKTRLLTRVSSMLLRPNRSSFPSHDFGLVGFVKQLVDEQGAADLTRAHQSSKPKRLSKFRSMTITPSIVFVSKR
jgi:hypothetical protein